MIRLILHDPTEYPDPFEFQPERFLKDGKLNPEVQDPEVACFGFGRRFSIVSKHLSYTLLKLCRRICAGRGFAKNSLFSIIVSTLHIYNIAPALDETGSPINVEPVMTPGIISYVTYCYLRTSYLTDHLVYKQDTLLNSRVLLHRDRPRLKR